ncbi:LLM class flavin-dependent oxidoreductase [Pseudonocardia spinosispora]|uniref:LLM class flavin-dependent oxidoreductase n=1 Tax=Pseudonocardia spinosispora TaxID=103441 RepID=UPI00041C57B0|nr:LLM class flavin-dependent oxidoreductase [Pseudonocardia spinosispora]
MRVGITLGRDERNVAAEARWAEGIGFDFLACGEHLFFHGPTGNGFVTLAAAAGATERIRLLSALTIVPVYPAAILAKLAASLDQVSNGRFDLGIGIGGEYPPEFVAAGVEVKHRGARTDEALEVLGPLLAGETVTHHGRFVDIPGLALQPPAVQKPGPPVWVGGRKGAAIRRAARFGDVWLPYMYSPEQLASSLTEVNTAAAEHGRSVRGAVYCWGAVHAEAATARQQAIDVVSEVYQQDFTPLADRYLLHGDPAGVVRRLREYYDAGARDVVFSAAAPNAQARTEMLELFASEVLPQVRTWTD